MMKRKKQIILVAIILLLAIITVIGCFFLNENTSINQFKGTSNNSNAGVTQWDVSESGSSVTATLSNDGTLTISGTGRIKDFVVLHERLHERRKFETYYI